MVLMQSDDFIMLPILEKIPNLWLRVGYIIPLPLLIYVDDEGVYVGGK